MCLFDADHMHRNRAFKKYKKSITLCVKMKTQNKTKSKENIMEERKKNDLKYRLDNDKMTLYRR